MRRSRSGPEENRGSLILRGGRIGAIGIPGTFVEENRRGFPRSPGASDEKICGEQLAPPSERNFLRSAIVIGSGWIAGEHRG